MAENGAPESKARYVWDREKLAWVEAAGSPPAEESQVQPEAGEQPALAADNAVTENTYPIEASSHEVELQYRGASIRLAATAFDFFVVLVIAYVLNLIFGIESSVARYVMPIVGIMYFAGMWGWRGQSPGKMLVGAMIVRTDGSPVGFRRAFVRYVVYMAYFLAISSARDIAWVAVLIALIVFLTVALSREKRGLHDRLAGTIVINTRPKTLEEYADEEYEEEEPSYMEAEQEPPGHGEGVIRVSPPPRPGAALPTSH